MNACRPHRNAWLTALGTALVAVGCGAGLAHPDARDATWASGKWPGTTVGDLEHGRAVFVSRCAGCHNLPHPESKTPDEWATVVGDMATGARLTAADQDLVLRYLSATSQRIHQGG
jgi:mono/diheme cytochrome c family protein